MQSALLQHGSSVVANPLRLQRHRAQRRVHVQSQSGRNEPFNEGAVQVKRLVDRDRQQMLGNKIDILDKLETEFGDPSDEPSTRPVATAVSATPAASSATATSSSSTSTGGSSSSSSTTAAPSAAAPSRPAAPAAVKTNFGGSGGTASPFGTASRTRSVMEPKGLSPDMSPDPIVKQAPTPGNFLSKITLTQVVLFCTFSSMIVLMLATFSVVVNSGAVRLAGIE